MGQEPKAENITTNSRENVIESCPGDNRLIFVTWIW